MILKNFVFVISVLLLTFLFNKCQLYHNINTLRNLKRPKKTYTPDVEAKLDVARRLFKKFDADGSGYLDEKEIIELLKATYEQIGIKNQYISKDDVEIWLSMSDRNKDGRVDLDEYEDVVISSLEKAGFKIEASHIVLK